MYRDQGVSIHDKHIELIVRQMTRRIACRSRATPTSCPASGSTQKVFRDINRALVEEGKQPAEGRPELMGITKASLATDSWLSAASFQETTRVLTEAAIEAASDGLLGLKENIIIGKLIPAGTGMDALPGHRHRRPRTTSRWSSTPRATTTPTWPTCSPSAWPATSSPAPATWPRAAGEQPDAQVIELPQAEGSA